MSRFSGLAPKRNRGRLAVSTWVGGGMFCGVDHVVLPFWFTTTFGIRIVMDDRHVGESRRNHIVHCRNNTTVVSFIGRRCGNVTVVVFD